VLSGTKSHVQDDVDVMKWVESLEGEGNWRKVTDDEKQMIENLLE